MTAPVILDLCGGSGSWSRPYRDAGYRVILVDPAGEPLDSVREDVRLWLPPRVEVRGVLAAPPCTALSVSGARWWSSKGPEALLDALSVVDACLRIVALVKPRWWSLENPVGRLSHYLGAPARTFQPWEYGDGYQKRTCLWGTFAMPEPVHLVRPDGTDTRIHRAAPGPGRARLRSITPGGFAEAFARVNL